MPRVTKLLNDSSEIKIPDSSHVKVLVFQTLDVLALVGVSIFAQ